MYKWGQTGLFYEKGKSIDRICMSVDKNYFLLHSATIHNYKITQRKRLESCDLNTVPTEAWFFFST